MGTDPVTFAQIVELAKTVLQAPVLLALAGALISLLTSYVPGFREWYAAQTESVKSLGQLLAITVVTTVAGVLSWTGVMAIIPEGTPGVVILVFSWFNALYANQTTHRASPQRPSVIEAKEKGKLLRAGLPPA